MLEGDYQTVAWEIGPWTATWHLDAQAHEQTQKTNSPRLPVCLCTAQIFAHLISERFWRRVTVLPWVSLLLYLFPSLLDYSFYDSSFTQHQNCDGR